MQAVVSKYLACTEFSEVDGVTTCTAQAWVDTPAVIPPLSMGDGFVIATAIGVVWIGAVAAVLPRQGARTSR